jgi:hypothetical protein
LPFAVTTREIGGRFLSHIVFKLPVSPTNDDDAAGEDELAVGDGGAEGEHASPEFLRMVAAWEASQGEETPELEAATAAFVSTVDGSPCACGSGRLRRDCCGK